MHAGAGNQERRLVIVDALPSTGPPRRLLRRRRPRGRRGFSSGCTRLLDPTIILRVLPRARARCQPRARADQNQIKSHPIKSNQPSKRRQTKSRRAQRTSSYHGRPSSGDTPVAAAIISCGSASGSGIFFFARPAPRSLRVMARIGGVTARVGHIAARIGGVTARVGQIAAPVGHTAARIGQVAVHALGLLSVQELHSTGCLL